MRITLYQLRVKGQLLCFNRMQRMYGRELYLSRAAALAQQNVAAFVHRCTTATSGLFDLDPDTLGGVEAGELELNCTRDELLRLIEAHDAKEQADD